MLYHQFEVYSIGIHGGHSVLGALHYSLDDLLNWCRDEEERAHCIAKMHDITTSRGILDFDYTEAGGRVWHEFSVS